MATFDTQRTSATHTGAIASFFANLIGDIAAWNDARVTRKALSRLTARELDDIGLTHADLDRIGSITR